MALVITGTQRSGTSAIAKLFIEMGYDLGSYWFDETVQGGYENLLACAFYRYWLGDDSFPFIGAPYGKYGPGEISQGLLPVMFSQMDYKVLKFSYLCMNPVFVSIWHKFRPHQDKFLIMHRDPNAVVRSKEAHRDQFDLDSLLLSKSSRGLRANFGTSVELLGSVGEESWMLPFPDCLDDFDMVDEAVMSLVDVKIPLGIWEEVVDKSKVHF